MKLRNQNRNCFHKKTWKICFFHNVFEEIQLWLWKKLSLKIVEVLYCMHFLANSAHQGSNSSKISEGCTLYYCFCVCLSQIADWDFGGRNPIQYYRENWAQKSGRINRNWNRQFLTGRNEQQDNSVNKFLNPCCGMFETRKENKLQLSRLSINFSLTISVTTLKLKWYYLMMLEEKNQKTKG